MGQERYHSLDAARGLLMLIGIYFHIIVFHYGESWLGQVGWATHFFRMHTFFLISGFFSALVLYRKGHYQMLDNRFKRILLPLITLAWPIWILLIFGMKFNELRYENGILYSLKQSLFQYIEEPWVLIPWETMHLWFLSFLFFMSLFSYILRNRFSNNFFLKISKKSIRLIFDKPWIGMLVFCFSYSLLLSALNKFEAQGKGGWSSWIWVFKENGLKTFIAFSFFYFVGWQMYHFQEKMVRISMLTYFKILLTFSIFIHILNYSLYYLGYNNPVPKFNTMHRNFYGLNDDKLDPNRKKQKVTFLVNMSNKDVMPGKGDTAAVYVCILELGEPSGIKMTDLGNDIWKSTIELNPGVYEYKFRNGLYDNWGGEPDGWENGKKLDLGGCGFGEYDNRKFKLENKDIMLGIFCWSECSDCSGNDIPFTWSKEEQKKENYEVFLVNKLFIFLMNFLVPAYTMLVLSFFIRFCSRPSKILKYVSDSAYWIYIIHLPLSFFIPAFFHQSKIHLFIKFIISSIIVSVICFISYHYFVRNSFLGKFLNGKKFN